ncbi:hypothetical protein ScPMuIL_016301 [Solemya velum]
MKLLIEAKIRKFPVDRIRSCLTDEIHTEEDGLCLKELNKTLDYNLLYHVLHRTYNMHTANWNMANIRKAAHLLDHRVLTFQDVYNIRLAYQAYEAYDMKGMVLDQWVLLRTLKMCERVVSPLKLMHRVKHMRGSLEEKDRIQLSEFMDLILWCGVYNSYSEGELASVQGKENQLFKLVDFDQLLSHHDDRLARFLNAQYLEEEWHFGPVVSYTASQKLPTGSSLKTDNGIENGKKERQIYKSLKCHVNQSQKQVYHANAGFVRQRPLSAPNLDQFLHKKELASTPGVTAHTAYISIQKLIKSLEAPRQSDVEKTEMRKTCEWTKAKLQIPSRIITQSDIKETEEKLQCLMFDVETLEGRCQMKKENEMNHYIPKYPGTKAAIQHDESPSVLSLPPEKNRSQNYRKLAYPSPRQCSAHSKTCDARYRGWDKEQRKVEPQYILISDAFENCSQGRLYHKLKRVSSAEVNKVHSENFLYRPVKSPKSKQRPKTAPAFFNRSSTQKIVRHSTMSSKDDTSILVPEQTNSSKSPSSESSPDSSQWAVNENNSNSSNENKTETRKSNTYSEMDILIGPDLHIHAGENKVAHDSHKGEHKAYSGEGRSVKSVKAKRKKDTSEHFIVSQLLAKEKAARQRKVKKIKEQQRLHDKTEEGFSFRLSQKARLLDLLVSKKMKSKNSKTKNKDRNHMRIAQEHEDSMPREQMEDGMSSVNSGSGEVHIAQEYEEDSVSREQMEDGMSFDNNRSGEGHFDSDSVSSDANGDFASLFQEGPYPPLCDEGDTTRPLSIHSRYHSKPHRLLERGEGQLSETFTRRLHETGFIAV